MKKKITPAQRRHQDYLRLKGLKVGKVFESRLMKLRRAEVKRVLELCKDVNDPQFWPMVIDGNFHEDYLPKWYEGLYLNTGLPMAKSVTRDLTLEKADTPGGLWEQEMISFAQGRVGENIVIVEGTVKDSLRSVLGKVLEENIGIGIDKLARTVYDKYSADLLLWQVRRIAQTETMISLADSADMAARALDIGFTKEWCISGVGNTRDSHMKMDGVVVDQNDPFVVSNVEMGTITYLQYPHDTTDNPPAYEIINCACSCIRMPK